MRRKIVKINLEKCTGCGLCVPDCPEGALQIIDGKARLISDLFCDGLGACIGSCPENAITIEEREAEPYDEKKAMENIVKQGENTIKAHLKHLLEHGEMKYFNEALDYLKENNIDFDSDSFIKESHSSHHQGSQCPGSKVFEWEDIKDEKREIELELASELRNWPVQIKLVPPFAPYLKNANLLIAADCVAFSYANFHQEFLKGKVLFIGCPKLDDAKYYIEKLTVIFKNNDINSINVVIMEVPCCSGLDMIVKEAIRNSGKNIPYAITVIGIKGKKL